MAETTDKIFKSIQLLRNASIASNKADAIDMLTANTSGIADGTPLVIRYGNGDKAILGIVYKNDTTSKVAFVDLNNDASKTELESKLSELESKIETLEDTVDANKSAIKEHASFINDSVVNEITKDGDTITVNKTVKEVTEDSEEINEKEEALKLNYASSMPDNLTTPNAVGGIAKGIAAETLKSKTYGQIIDMILFPELFPTIANPSATIELKDGFAANGVYEIGADAPVDPTNFTTNLVRGNCTVAGQSTKNRAGALVAADSFIYYGGSTSNKTLPEKITSGAMSYNYHAAYSEGDVLVTSYGNPATKNASGTAIVNPLAAGSVNSSAVTIYGTYPYFSNGTTASTSAIDNNLPSSINTTSVKLPLAKLDTTLIGVKYGSESAFDTRLFFEFPTTKQVTKVEFMDPGSKDWKVIASNNYTVASSGNKTIQEKAVAYNKLTTSGDLMGAIQLRFTMANA